VGSVTTNTGVPGTDRRYRAIFGLGPRARPEHMRLGDEAERERVATVVAGLVIDIILVTVNILIQVVIVIAVEGRLLGSHGGHTNESGGRDNICLLGVRICDKLVENAMPLLELIVVAATQLEFLGGYIPNDVKNIGASGGNGEDRLDVVDIDAAVQVKGGLGTSTAGLLLLLGDLLTAEEDLFKEIDLKFLVG
jgi:hypothetical protein